MNLLQIAVVVKSKRMFQNGVEKIGLIEMAF